MSEVSLFTVIRIPYTAGAKRAAGYGSVEIEVEAASGSAAIAKAQEMCEWQDPKRNFSWRISGVKILPAQHAVPSVRGVTADREAIIREVLVWIESEYSGVTATKLAMDHARRHFGPPVEANQPDDEGGN